VERVGNEAADRALEVAGEAGEGEVEARPALAGNGGEQRLGLALDLVGEQMMEAMAAEAFALLDDQQRHLGAKPGQSERGKATGRAAARDQYAVPSAARHAALYASVALPATPPRRQPHFGTVEKGFLPL
jgi:hypothetical protein